MEMQSIIKASSVVVQAEPEPVATSTECPESSVRLLSIEGRVHAIELRCQCGEAHVIELEYEAPAAPNAPAEMPT